MTRRKIVGVMGSGDEEFAELAEAAGRAVARGGYHLLTGGGGGTMTAVARAFVGVPDRAGLSLGVVRADGTDHLGAATTSRRYRSRGPNAFVEVPVLTHLPLSGGRGKDDLSRNHINVLTAAAVIVLPGGAGTLSELELAVEYGRPVLLFLGPHRVADVDAATLSGRFGPAAVVVTEEGNLATKLRDVAGKPLG